MTVTPLTDVARRLLVNVERDAVIAPSAAVQRGPDSTFVYVVRPDETVELKTIRTGPAEGDETVIESGIKRPEHFATALAAEEPKR